MTDVEHPDDRAARMEAEAQAAEAIDTFFDENRERFKSIVQTYADGKAEELFEILREMFWANLDDHVKAARRRVEVP